MEFISKKTVVEYEYDNEILMKIHEDEMINDGWYVSSVAKWSPFRLNNDSDEFYREYTYIHNDGIFL